MGPDDLKMLRETYRLSVENNKMLRRMRRQALVHTMAWLIIYAALIVAPIWFYMTYLDGAVRNVLKAYDSIQGAGTQTAAEYQNLRNAFDALRAKIPGMNTTAASSSPR